MNFTTDNPNKNMKHIVFDIETIPQDEAKLLALAPEFTAPANLKDPDEDRGGHRQEARRLPGRCRAELEDGRGRADRRGG